MTLSHRRRRRLPASPSSHPKLVSAHPTTSAPANVRISHVQLRDLIVCPAQRGVLWYVSDNGILEQDIISNTPPQSIASLKFTPVTLSTLRLASSCPGGKDVVILAAGGQDAELFLGMYLYHPRRTRQGKHQQISYEPRGTVTSSEDISIEVDGDEIDLDVKEEEEEDEHPGYSTSVWQHTSSLVGSINNNVLLYMPPPPLHEHDLYEDNEEDREVSPRLVVSNNDCTVKFFDVCLARKGLRRPPALQRPQETAAAAVDTRYWRQDPGYAYRATYEGEGWEKGNERVVRYERVGCLRLPVPVNHTSISPDGSTILSCGDASTVYLHRILPVRDGSTLLFEPLATYTIPPPTPLPPLPPPSSSPVSQRRTFLHRYVGQNDPGGQYLPFAFVNGSWVLAGPHPYLSDVSGMEIPPACFTTAWSADGMRFAVASQEGMVRVWDVRSKEPLGCAGWETGPGGAAAAAAATASVSASASDATSGEAGNAQDGDESLSSAIATAALNYDTQRALFEFTGGAPPWGVRSLKFARNPSGREVLVFTEHVSRVHVIDADTFSRHDVLRIPHVQPSTSAGPAARDLHSHQYPRLHHHHHQHRSSGARLPVFRPAQPQSSSSTSLNTPPPSTNNAATPTAQMYAIPPADLPRWLLDGAANANAGYSYVPNFLFNTSAVWRGAEDAAVPRVGPGPGPGVDGATRASGANAATTAATPRLASRLEGRARARRLGLVPPRISRPESEREGNNAGPNSTNLSAPAPTGRVLSPSLPLTRSPDPVGTSLFRTSLHDYGVEPERGEDAGNSAGSDTDYPAHLRRRYSAVSSSGSGSGSGSVGTIGAGRAGRRDVMVRLREMERARRQGEAQEGSELRRRSPAILRSRDPAGAGAGVEGNGESRLRDDAQMEEDIAFHVARERERELEWERERERDRDRDRDRELLYRIREVRERIQAGRAREQARAREEREQDELELEQEREAAYAPVLADAEGGPVIIPPLSSTRSEEDVRGVLAAHGIASVRAQALAAETGLEQASVEAQEEGADDARSEHSQALFGSDERRPGSSSSASSSSASSTTPSSISGVTGYTGITGVSTRAQAGSLVGEMHGASASADMGMSTVLYPHAASEPGAGDDFEANENPGVSTSTRRRRLDSAALMTPSIRNMRAAQAALRAMDDALDDYRMEVDDDVDSHSHADPERDVDLDEDRDAEGEEEEESDSDATELDCAEPPGVLGQGRTAEGEGLSLNPEVSVSSSTSASLSSQIGPASTTQPPSSSSSISSASSSTPFQPTHYRSQSLPIPQSQQQRQPIPQSQPQSQFQSQPQQQQQSQPQGQTLPPCRDLIESTDRLDIAGITFDPSGAYMYVATVDGITEWAVQGVEQRWWHTGGCL